MIVVDMPMPDKCLFCPMSYMIRTGAEAGETMCEAREANGIDVHECLVDICQDKRPENCPIIGILDDDGK